MSCVGGGTMKMPAQQVTILNVQAKLKNSYQLLSLSKTNSMPVKKSSKKVVGKGLLCSEKYNHILVCKIKDSQIMFSFIIEASLLEQDPKANGLGIN